jgi:photosystem II stability/assembly factor-like uncharacterized protein
VGGLPTETVNGFAVDPTDPKLMYVAMREGIYRSVDAGEKWTLATGGPKNAVAVAVHPKRRAEVYAASAEGAIFVSRDGGQRWDPVR